MGLIKVQYGIEGLRVIDLTIQGHTRGYSMETYNAKDMKETPDGKESMYSYFLRS